MKKVLSILLAIGFVFQAGIFSATLTPADLTAYAAAKVAVTSVKLTPSVIQLAAGNTGTVKATVSPSTATNKAVSWKSSNTAVVTVSNTGTVTALSIGTATITCTAKDGSGKKAVCKATVVKPSTPAQMLAAYTTVMNKAKISKPAFKKLEYQALPANKINVTQAGKIITPLLKLAGRFMTTEAQAKENPGVYAKGNDMRQFPVKYSSKGCLLKDAGAIKSAVWTKLSNGNYQIKIVLNSETNPEHYQSGTTAPSKTGSMFYPLSKSDVNPELGKWYVKAVISNARYSLKYYNCTAVLVYNPKTNRVVTLNQDTYTLITMSGKAVGINASGTAVLEMHYKFYDVKY